MWNLLILASFFIKCFIFPTWDEQELILRIYNWLYKIISIICYVQRLYWQAFDFTHAPWYQISKFSFMLTECTDVQIWISHCGFYLLWFVVFFQRDNPLNLMHCPLTIFQNMRRSVQLGTNFSKPLNQNLKSPLEMRTIVKDFPAKKERCNQIVRTELCSWDIFMLPL